MHHQPSTHPSIPPTNHQITCPTTKQYTDWLATLDKALDDDGGSDGDGDGGGGGGGGDGLGADGEEQPLALHELFGQRVLMYSLAELVSLPTLLSLATACRFTLEQFDASG